jgi:hypothetical protein
MTYDKNTFKLQAAGKFRLEETVGEMVSRRNDLAPSSCGGKSKNVFNFRNLGEKKIESVFFTFFYNCN